MLHESVVTSVHLFDSKKGKGFPYLLPSVVPGAELILVYMQSARR